MPIFDEREKDENKCSVCGMALYNHEIGAAILDAALIEFDSRSWGEVSLVVCSDCWSKINGNIHENYDVALKRRREIDPTFTPERKKNGD
jgi:imidazole glycerol phosphate synthase subunit HisF